MTNYEIAAAFQQIFQFLNTCRIFQFVNNNFLLFEYLHQSNPIIKWIQPRGFRIEIDGVHNPISTAYVASLSVMLIRSSPCLFWSVPVEGVILKTLSIIGIISDNVLPSFLF